MHKFPTNPEVGDMVALANRVLLVWTGTQWYLLGGEHLPLSPYERAVNYLVDGWGESQTTFEHDLETVIPPQLDPYFREIFIKRCLDANNLILGDSAS